MRIRHLIAALLPLLCLVTLAHAQTAPAKPATARVATAKQFSSEAEAKTRCPTDSVVWVNKTSKAIHAAGTKYYGQTKSGAYMCRKEADAAGFHSPRARTSTAAKPSSTNQGTNPTTR